MITPLPLSDYSFTMVITTVYPKVHISLLLVTFETTCKAAYSNHLNDNPGNICKVTTTAFQEISMLSTCSGKYQ